MQYLYIYTNILLTMNGSYLFKSTDFFFNILDFKQFKAFLLIGYIISLNGLYGYFLKSRICLH